MVVCISLLSSARYASCQKSFNPSGMSAKACIFNYDHGKMTVHATSLLSL